MTRVKAESVVNLFSNLDRSAAGELRTAVIEAVDKGQERIVVNLSCSGGDPAAILELCDFLHLSGIAVQVHNVGIVGEVPMLFYLSAEERTSAPEASFEMVVCSIEEMHSRLSLRSVGFSDEAIENMVVRQRMRLLLADRFGLSMDGDGIRRLLVTAPEAEHLGLAEICDVRLFRDGSADGPCARDLEGRSEGVAMGAGDLPLTVVPPIRVRAWST